MKKINMNSDTALKFLSVIFAICLWFYVVQVENPDIERTIKGVPVVFAGQEELADKNLIMLNDNEQTVDITIQGSRKYVMDTNSKNLIVRADVSGIASIGNHPVVVNTVAPYASVQIIEKNPSTLTIEVDTLITVEKNISVITDGAPKDPYIVGNLTTSSEKVRVTGPKTIISSIQTVAAVVDVSGKTADVATKVPLVAMGSGGTAIDSHLLSFSFDEAEVHAEILKTKTVALQPVFHESLRQKAEALQLDESSIRSVRLAGLGTAVDELAYVHTKPITAANLNEDNVATVELELPAGMRCVDGNSFTLKFSPKN